FISEAENHVRFWSRDNIISGIKETLDKLTVNPTLYIGERDQFYYSELETMNQKYDEKIHFDTLSELLDEFYHSRYVKQSIKQKANDYLYVIEQAYDKTKRKIENLKEDIKESYRKDDYQKYGELLTAYMHEVKPFSKEVTVFDYYENKEISIALNVKLSTTDNAKSYYNLKNNMRNREIEAQKQLKLAEIDVEYLERLLHQMEMTSRNEEVDENREALMQESFIKKRKSKTRSKERKV